MASNSLASDVAWVLGGSVSGLLAARALSDQFKQVFVVERDTQLGETTPRKGAPQGRHVHAFLPRGVESLEYMFPGIFDEIVTGGATNGDLCGDAQWCPGGNRLKRSQSSLPVIAATRPFIESFIARRVENLPNVAFVTSTVGTGIEVKKNKIVGIHLRKADGTEQTHRADVVVDATGRASQLPKWLKELGLTPPREDRIDVQLRYATARFERSTAAKCDLKAAIVGASADRPRGGIAQAVENDVLQVSMAEYNCSPPTKIAEFVDYAKTLPQPDLYNWMRGAEPIDDQVTTQRIPCTYRRHFDKLKDLPDGLLALGDSVCAFNPVYAQGMTVAAVEAETLMRCLEKGTKNLSRRFFRSIRHVTGVTWQIGSTNDLSLPQVTGKRTLQTKIIGSWINLVQRVATHDADVAEQFIRVAALLDPPTSLLQPGFAIRVLLGSLASKKSQTIAVPATP